MGRCYFYILFLCFCFNVSGAPFMDPPQIIKANENNYQSAKTRKFVGIPSLAISSSGRIWTTWYAGKTVGEDHNNYVVLSTSGDDGKSWEEILIIDPDGEGPVRAFDPELWIDPIGRLWLFWAQHIRTEDNPACPIAGVWAMVNENPSNPASYWSEPRRLENGVMMCKPIVLSSGKWLFPISTWRTTDYSALAVISEDKGKTFDIIGACNIPLKKRSFDEHMFIQLRDGILWMLVRTKDGIGESWSKDEGHSWSNLLDSNIKHTSARIFIRRLKSSNLLLVKHGKIDQNVGRSHLMAFISEDDGKSWKGGFVIDERKSVSYPDGQQADDGVIYLTYDFSRTEYKKILMACFTEQDVLAGKKVTDKVRLKMSVN